MHILAVRFQHTVGIALAAYGIARTVHLDTERVGHSVGADSLEAFKFSYHLADMNWIAHDVCPVWCCRFGVYSRN